MMQRRAFHLLTSIPVLIYVNDNIIGFSTVHGSAVSSSSSSAAAAAATTTTATTTTTTAPSSSSSTSSSSAAAATKKEDLKWSIQDKSIILTNKLKSKLYENIKTDDILVLIDPIEPHRLILRKVKAVSGDFVWQVVNDGDFYYKQRILINDNYLWIESLSHRNENDDEIEEDSREYQQVSSGLVQGVAIATIYPPSRWNIF